MEFLSQLQALVTNEILIVPAFAWLVAQLLKTLINGVVHKEWSPERLWGDGGMPSGHSATVTSLSLMCGFLKGFGSVYFAITLLLAIIVMHDALGVRRETGKQAVSIIKMVAIINEYVVEKDEEIKTDKLKVLVGHTPLQVVCGALVGTIVVLIYVLGIKNLFGLFV